jgi:hypothetical protein
MLENPALNETPADRSQHMLKRRTTRKKAHRLGRFMVLSMIAVALAYYTLRLFLVLQGHIHPALDLPPDSGTTLLIATSIITTAGVLCLFVLYRGSRPVRFLYGIASTISALVFATLLANGLVRDLPLLWSSFNFLALLSSLFAAWTCLLSHSASRFLTSQSDKY